MKIREGQDGGLVSASLPAMLRLIQGYLKIPLNLNREEERWEVRRKVRLSMLIRYARSLRKVLNQRISWGGGSVLGAQAPWRS